jgi:hypothetical protein
MSSGWGTDFSTQSLKIHDDDLSNVEVHQPQADNRWLTINDSGCGNLAMSCDVVLFLPIDRSVVLYHILSVWDGLEISEHNAPFKKQKAIYNTEFHPP